MPQPNDLTAKAASRAVQTARAIIGDDWATALAIATNLSPQHWERVERGDFLAPPAAVEAIYYVDQVMLTVEALSIGSDSDEPKKIAPHPDQEVRRIALALLTEIAADIKRL